MEKEITKKYKTSDLTVVWKPKTCIHAAVCVKELPQVYNPKAKPWITLESASTNALISQIKKCPSGALSYYMNDENQMESNSSETKIDILKDGPLIVHGTLKVKANDGTIEDKSNVTAFCRCGASDKKPYCDGAHKKIGFKD